MRFIDGRTDAITDVWITLKIRYGIYAFSPLQPTVTFNTGLSTAEYLNYIPFNAGSANLCA